MNFAKGWGRIAKVLLIVAVICTALLIYSENTNSLTITFCWLPYLVAKIIGWIVKGFIGNGKTD